MLVLTTVQDIRAIQRLDGVLVEIAGPVLRGGKSQLFYLNDGKSAYLDTPDNPKL